MHRRHLIDKLMMICSWDCDKMTMISQIVNTQEDKYFAIHVKIFSSPYIKKMSLGNFSISEEGNILTSKKESISVSEEEKMYKEDISQCLRRKISQYIWRKISHPGLVIVGSGETAEESCSEAGVCCRIRLDSIGINIIFELQITELRNVTDVADISV